MKYELEFVENSSSEDGIFIKVRDDGCESLDNLVDLVKRFTDDLSAVKFRLRTCCTNRVEPLMIVFVPSKALKHKGPLNVELMEVEGFIVIGEDIVGPDGEKYEWQYVGGGRHELQKSRTS